MVEYDSSSKKIFSINNVFYPGKEFLRPVEFCNLHHFSNSIASFAKGISGDYLVDMDEVSVGDSSWAAALITQMKEDLMDNKKKMYFCNLNESSVKMLSLPSIGAPLERRLLCNDGYVTTSK